MTASAPFIDGYPGTTYPILSTWPNIIHSIIYIHVQSFQFNRRSSICVGYSIKFAFLTDLPLLRIIELEPIGFISFNQDEAKFSVKGSEVLLKFFCSDTKRVEAPIFSPIGLKAQ